MVMFTVHIDLYLYNLTKSYNTCSGSSYINHKY